MRQWHGSTVCPLLFDGQYADGESGWAYNRFRYYSPDLGIYGAQDPLGLSPDLGWAQGYVSHPGCMVDVLGLKAHQVFDKGLQKQLDALTPNEKGALGEALTKERFDGQFDPERVRSDYVGNVTGKNRITDLTLNNGDIVESKMVKSQGLSSQLKDGIAEASNKGSTYHLVVGEGTHISSPLQKVIDAPDSVVQLHRLTGSEIQSLLK